MPAGQGLQEPAPAREYVPAGQMEGVGVVDPEAHAYPAVHSPEQVELVKPDVAP